MLTIHRRQIQQFERSDAPHFEPRSVRHLWEAFPRHCHLLGDAGVVQVVRAGRDRAAFHGLHDPSSAELFADLSLLLGREFDADPQLPWAHKTLADHEVPPLERSRRLHTAALLYLDRVSGPDNEWIDAAQSRIAGVALDAPRNARQFFAAVHERLQYVWPEKYDYLGRDRAEQLIRLGTDSAKRHGLRTPQGALLITGLMYMLGSGFARDPLFAWAHEPLVGQEQEPSKRVQMLHDAALNYRCLSA